MSASYKLLSSDLQIGLDFVTRPRLPAEVAERAERNEHVAWQPSVDEGCDELTRSGWMGDKFG